LGIDLGTTNSCVAVVDLAVPQVIANREGSRTTPSIIAFAEDGDTYVGQVAKRQAITNPTNTVFGVKRLIGRKYDEELVQEAREFLPYSLAEAANGDVKVQLSDRQLSPEEISAFVLREIKDFVIEATGEEVNEAVITVPAHFNDAQRQATRDAGRIAGLEVLRIINEPTAAALAYGVQQDQDRTIAIFDLGGGTFDISIVELTEGVFEVKATEGESYLGGEDFDQRIMDWAVVEFKAESGIDLRDDRMALQRLKEGAEQAKCDLSVAETTTIKLPFISANDSGPLHLSLELSRQQFEGLVEDLVERTTGPCEKALETAGITADQVDEVLLVGGQTRTPLVASAVERIFGKAPSQELNPDEVVAIGAAIQGGILRGDLKDIVLLDVTPLSLGVETHGGLFVKLIERNSTIPTKATQIFTTVFDNQGTVEVNVMQGEREIASGNSPLGNFELVGIAPAPRGVPQIEVTFAIDSNCIVNVSARDIATGKSQSIEINPAGGLKEEEVAQLIAEAEEHAEEDKEKTEDRRLRNRLEGMIFNTERVAEQFKDLITEKDRDSVKNTLLKARGAMGSDNRNDLETVMYDLANLANRISNLMVDGMGDFDALDGEQEEEQKKKKKK
jgi:molecular chaperone DnaK